MSTKQGKIGRHKFHGDPNRFEILAEFIFRLVKGGREDVQRSGFINQNFHGKVRRIADVAGGQGMLCRILKKKYGFECEVVDPRGFPLIGVENRKEEFKAEMADYYDLIVGLHPDEALQEVVLSALVRPTIVIPCCNFWDSDKTLGRDALISELEKFYNKNNIIYEKVVFDFEGPKNIGLVTYL